METETRFLLHAELDKWAPIGLRIIAQPIHFTEHGKVRNITADSYRPDALSDFIVCGRAHALEELGDTYSWKREYRDVFSVDTHRAAIMLKNLKAIDRGMEKMERELGYATSFPSYLARVASILKIRSYGWKTYDGGGGSYDTNEYYWGDATHMSDWVAREVKTFRESMSVAS